MRPVPATALFCLALAATTASTACAPVRIGSFTESKAILQAYRTYTWDAAGPGATGDPRLDNNRFFRERVVTAVDRELSRRGFERSVVGRPELIVRLQVRVDQKIETASLAVDEARCASDYCRVLVFDEGAVLLDVVDAETRRLLWRGWSESSFDGVVADQDWMEETIDRLVQQIFGRFPSRVRLVSLRH